MRLTILAIAVGFALFGPAGAQQPQQGQSLQQVVDAKTAEMTRTIGAFANQIIADQTQIEASTRESAELKRENADLKRQLAELQKKLTDGSPQVGTR